MQTPNTNGSFFDQENLKYLFLSSQGRINRQRFWQGYVTLVILDFVILMFMSGFALNLGLIVTLALLYPTIVLSIKRAHDRDRSGHFLWLSLIPLVNFWVLIEIGFLEGTQGDNQFGKDPLGSLGLAPMAATERQPNAGETMARQNQGNSGSQTVRATDDGIAQPSNPPRSRTVRVKRVRR